jgi:methylglutaconyl-CoA hydratase
MISLAPHEEHPEIAILTLDRHEKRNALTVDILDAIADVYSHLEYSAPEARALVLRGNGKVFCAGFDLTLAKENPDITTPLLSSLSRACRAVRRLEIPVVCAAHGAAIAGGCALVSACDVVVAEKGAKFGYPVVTIGIAPAVTTPLLVQQIGLGRTRERVLDPGLIDGAHSARIGLVHELVESIEDVYPTALRVARDFISKPMHSVRETKKWLNQLDNTHSDVVFDESLMCSVQCARSASAHEALAAKWKD